MPADGQFSVTLGKNGHAPGGTTPLELGHILNLYPKIFVGIDVDGVPLGGRQRLLSAPYSSGLKNVTRTANGTSIAATTVSANSFDAASVTANSVFASGGVHAGTVTTNGPLKIQGVEWWRPFMEARVDSNYYIRLRGGDSFWTNGEDALWLDHNGNLGIHGAFSTGDKVTIANPTSSNHALTVNGVIATETRRDDCPNGWGCQLRTWGMSIEGIYYSYMVQRSDARLKEQIQTLTDAPDKLRALRGVSYLWRDRRQPGKQLGFIAQEVEKVLPELVSTDDEGMKSVNYVAVVPLLVESLKAQDRRIDALERALAKREARLSATTVRKR
jgi:hypothetical protein